MLNAYPMGPGWLMFFQNPEPTPPPEPPPPQPVVTKYRKFGRFSQPRYKDDEEHKKRIQKIMREDEEILEFIIAFVTKGP